MAGVDLSGYVDVAERLHMFFDRYPDGSLQATVPHPVELDGKHFLEVTVTVYRSPTDPTPAVASAWEPFPGRTPYTRDSEAMNCETSAAGRALAFLGLGIRRSIATTEEVRARQPQPQPAPQPDRARPSRQSAGLKQLRAELRKQIPDPAERQEFVEAVVDHSAAALEDLTTDELDAVTVALAELANPPTPEPVDVTQNA